MSNLPSLRKQIDRVDLQLLRLLNQRAALALRVGRIKNRKKWPVFDPAREASVLRHIERKNRGPLPAAAVRRIFQAILTQCRRREHRGGRRIEK